MKKRLVSLAALLLSLLFALQATAFAQAAPAEGKRSY